MKKTILSLLAAIMMAFSFSSCEHQTMRTTDFTINKWYQDGNLLTSTFYWPELDEDVVDFGMVNVYFYDRNGSQNQLPFVYAATYPTDDGGTLTIAENITYYYGPGFITITIEDMDGGMPGADVWPSYSFRVVALGD